VRRLFYKTPSLTAARVLEYTGAAFGLLGAGLLASGSGIAQWGWVAFLASNLALIAFAAAYRHRGLILLQVGYTATSLIGIANSFAPSMWASLATRLGLV
jgi:hypothetical protein